MEHSLVELDKMLAAGYVLGDLSEEELIKVHELLQTNPEFLQEVRSLTASLNLVPTALPKFIPPASVRSKILARFSKFEQSK
ncbi:MAG: hypothetical protein AAF063_22480 [Cyanobacteria bacterium J06643_5]